MSSDADLVTLTTVPTAFESEWIVGALKGFDIVAVTSGDQLADEFAVSQMLMGLGGGVRVMVARSDLERAQEALVEIEQVHPTKGELDAAVSATIAADDADVRCDEDEEGDEDESADGTAEATVARGPGKTIAMAVLGVAVVVLAGMGSASYFRAHADEQQGKHQVSQLLAMLIAQRTASNGTRADARHADEGLYGKNVALSLVASGQLDPTDRSQLGLLFRKRMIPPGIDASSYDGVTMEALRTRRFPHLTDVLGRAELVGRHSYTASQSEAGTPMIALALPSFLVVGYSSGQAVFEDRGEQLPSWLSDE